MSYRTFKRAYLLLAVGVFLGFFGHGAWAAFENFEKFRGLLSDSLVGGHEKLRAGGHGNPG